MVPQAPTKIVRHAIAIGPHHTKDGLIEPEGITMPDAGSILESASTLGSLGDVLTWLRSFDPPGEFLDVVGLDEFTNDVIVRVRPDAYAVFDAT
jgi:hypothetical protein